MTPNEEHRKDFGDNPPIIGWGKVKSLKDHLVSVKFKWNDLMIKKLTFSTHLRQNFLYSEDVNKNRT